MRLEDYRRLFNASPLPDEYQLVKWVKFTTSFTSGIALGTMNMATDTLDTVYKADGNSYGSATSWIGNGYTGTLQIGQYEGYNNINHNCRFYLGTSDAKNSVSFKVDSSNTGDTNTYTSCILDKGNILINGELIDTYPLKDITITLSLHVPAYIKHIRLSNSEGVKLDLYPCYRKSDNVGGLYDVISGTFYTQGATYGGISYGN